MDDAGYVASVLRASSDRVGMAGRTTELESRPTKTLTDDKSGPRVSLLLSGLPDAGIMFSSRPTGNPIVPGHGKRYDSVWQKASAHEEEGMKQPADATRVIELAEQLAERFEKIGLAEDGTMDIADKRLVDRLRAFTGIPC